MLPQARHQASERVCAAWPTGSHKQRRCDKLPLDGH